MELELAADIIILLVGYTYESLLWTTIGKVGSQFISLCSSVLLLDDFGFHR